MANGFDTGYPLRMEHIARHMVMLAPFVAALSNFFQQYGIDPKQMEAWVQSLLGT
jgi:hypothetical protein